MNVYECASMAVVDPTPLHSIQRRLKSVIALATSDVSRAACLQHVTLLVRDGYKQLTKSMLELEGLIFDSPPSKWLIPEASKSSVVNSAEPSSEAINIEEWFGNISIISAHTKGHFSENANPQLRDIECYVQLEHEHDFCGSMDESVSRNETIASSKYDYENTPSILLCSPFVNDKRKSTAPSPSDVKYTYRSDDSWENGPLASFASYDLENTMPFVFTSPSAHGNSTDEDIRSLLSHSILLSRRHSYTNCRQRRRLSYGRIIFPRLTCQR